MAETIAEKTGNYRLYHDSVIRLHELYLEGKNKSPEAEALRSETDEPWFELSEEEQATLDGLSAKGEPKTASIFLKHAVELGATNGVHGVTGVNGHVTADPRRVFELPE